MIPELPPTYVDHAVGPQCNGDLCDANAAGEVGSMVGGLGVRMSLSYEATHHNGAVIRSVCWRAFGSAAPVAPLSWLATRILGQSWKEAGAHTPESVMAGLCGGTLNGTVLPDAVERGASFAVRALRRALGIAEHGMPADPTGEGILVCRCIGVGDRRIRRTIHDGASTPEAIGKACRAGTGCGSCRPDLLALLDEELRESFPVPDLDLHPVARIAIARAGPLLRALGLPLEEVYVDGERVVIRTGTPRAGVLLSPPSAVALTRHVLRETVCEDIQVVHAKA